MRFKALRSTFQRLVASAGLTTGLGRAVAGGCCPPPVEPIELVQRVDARSPDWAALLAACRADDSACTPVCKPFVPGPDVDGRVPAIIDCYIVDQARGATDVHVAYVWPSDGCVAGRRPPGLRAPVRELPAVLGHVRDRDAASVRAATERAAWLAGLVHLEAASIPAFLLLAGDLGRLGAPHGLIRAAHAAASDEVRHARTMSALARAAGATLSDVTIAPTPTRGLLDLALDNAVEGCVHESFAALCATHQAAHAADPVLRRVFATIAVDETRHAALAFALDAWLAPRLTRAERAHVVAARHAALDALTLAPLSPALAHAAGWPTGRALLSGFRTMHHHG